MSKKNDDFFKEKKPWSEVKDQLLGCYFKPYVQKILHTRNRNVFLYVDPYGIKALRCSMFDSFASAPFNSIELLINLNSFGFIREACNAMGVQLRLDDPTLFDDLVEYDPTKLTATDKAVQDLDEIAGGDYWQAIVRDYKAGHIDGYEAEEHFAEQYCHRLAQSYAYVLNMPLRIKRGQRPKYRMIHVTNHPDGCLLMVDNICNRWEAWQDVQSGGQFTLFQEDVNNQSIDEAEIRRKVEEHYSQLSVFTSLNMSMAQFFMKYGPICKTKDVKDALKDLEGRGRIQVLRDPAVTGTGRPSKFMEEKTNKQKVSLRWAQ